MSRAILLIVTMFFTSSTISWSAPTCLRQRSASERNPFEQEWRLNITEGTLDLIAQLDQLTLLARTIPSIQAYVFDIGGTLADEDEPTAEMIKALADLLNSGKNVVIVSGKAEKAFRPWIENKLMPLVGNLNRKLFSVYGDRVTKVYQTNEEGKLIEISRISFPVSANKKVILEISNKIANEIQTTLLANPAISSAVKEIIKDNPIKTKEGEEYIEVCAGKDIEVKGDKTAALARQILKSKLEQALKDAGLLTEELMVVLDGKKGAFIKSKQAEKPGAIKHVENTHALIPAQIFYIADQFAGKSTADLAVAEKTGVNCLNVGSEKQSGYKNVFNLDGGPVATLEFIRAVGVVESEIAKIRGEIVEKLIAKINEEPTMEMMIKLSKEMISRISEEKLDLLALRAYGELFGKLSTEVMQQYMDMFGDESINTTAFLNMSRISTVSRFFNLGRQDILTDYTKLAVSILESEKFLSKAPEVTTECVNLVNCRILEPSNLFLERVSQLIKDHATYANMVTSFLRLSGIEAREMQARAEAQLVIENAI